MVTKITNDDDTFEQFENHHSTQNDYDEPDKHRVALDKRSSNITILNEKDWRSKIRTRAITYLSRREYSRVELRKKVLFSLRDFECENEALGLLIIDEVFDDLTHNNWQSDERVAASVSKTKGERYGSARVKHELQQQGLASELISEVIEQLATTETQRAHEVWLKKFGQAPVDLKEKAKQVRFMASRGFSFDVINQVIKNADHLFENE